MLYLTRQVSNFSDSQMPVAYPEGGGGYRSFELIGALLVLTANLIDVL